VRVRFFDTLGPGMAAGAVSSLVGSTLIYAPILISGYLRDENVDIEGLPIIVMMLAASWVFAIFFAFFVVGPFAALIGWSLLRVTERQPDHRNGPFFALIGTMIGIMIFLPSFSNGPLTALGAICGAVAGYVFLYSFKRGRA
jgi:ABC-type phosphate transport system permease subunit